jgi:hypothetical protein
VTRIVEARITKSPNDMRQEFHHFRILCGRETSPDRYDCGVLGKVLDITWPAGIELGSPECSSYAYKGFADHLTLGLFDLRVGLRGIETAQVTPVSLTPWSPYDPTPPPYQRIWVAYHERGYRERPDGEFEVINRKSLRRNRQLTANSRAVGRRPMPEEIIE